MKSEQERMQKLLKNELTEEADKIIKEVEADESLKDIALPEELDAGLRAKIEQYEAEKAAYEMLSDKDKEAIRIGREFQIQMANDGNGDDDYGNGGDKGADGGSTDEENYNERRVVRFRKRRRMAFALVAIVAVMVMGFGMTSFGDVPFFTSVKNQIIGDKQMVQIDSNKERDSRENDSLNSGTDSEEKAYQEIKDNFGFDAVQLKELPQGTSFLEYSIDTEMKEAYLLYNCKNCIVEYRVLTNYQNKTFGYDVEDELLEEYSMYVGNVPIEIRHYKIKDNGEEQYMARFEYKKINYFLRGALNKKEFEEILKNLYFL